MKIVSVIKDGAVLDKILAHLQYKFEPLPLGSVRPRPILPPQWDSFSTDRFLSATFVPPAPFFCLETIPFRSFDNCQTHHPIPVSVIAVNQLGYVTVFTRAVGLFKKQLLIRNFAPAPFAPTRRIG
jgi:hypothetical protein